MSNKRSIKKAAKRTCGQIASECLCARSLVPGIDVAKIEEAVISVAELQFTTVSAVTFAFDKGRSAFANAHDYKEARRKYFRKGYAKLKNDFIKGVEEVVAKMNAALPSDKAAEPEAAE